MVSNRGNTYTKDRLWVEYEGYPGDSFVSFELSDEGDKTWLRLTHQVTESFPQDIPEFTRESCLGGWNFFIGENLKEFLEEGSP